MSRMKDFHWPAEPPTPRPPSPLKSAFRAAVKAFVRTWTEKRRISQIPDPFKGKP